MKNERNYNIISIRGFAKKGDPFTEGAYFQISLPGFETIRFDYNDEEGYGDSKALAFSNGFLLFVALNQEDAKWAFKPRFLGRTLENDWDQIPTKGPNTLKLGMSTDLLQWVVFEGEVKYFNRTKKDQVKESE